MPESPIVSGCHDIYDPIEAEPAVQPALSGGQGADSYLAVPATVTSGHACCLLSADHGAVRIVRVVGRLDWATEIRFRDLLRDECPDRSVIVDLSDAKLDAAGTGVVLASTARARKRNQQLVFVVVDPVELEVLADQGLGAVAPVVTSVNEALAWLATHDTPTAATRVNAAAP